MAEEIQHEHEIVVTVSYLQYVDNSVSQSITKTHNQVCQSVHH